MVSPAFSTAESPGDVYILQISLADNNVINEMSVLGAERGGEGGASRWSSTCMALHRARSHSPFSGYYLMRIIVMETCGTK